jgi:hypothetical protein
MSEQMPKGIYKIESETGNSTESVHSSSLPSLLVAESSEQVFDWLNRIHWNNEWAGEYMYDITGSDAFDDVDEEDSESVELFRSEFRRYVSAACGTIGLENVDFNEQPNQRFKWQRIKDVSAAQLSKLQEILGDELSVA